jgi:Spy/CpxP family protein refolding chaperone
MRARLVTLCLAAAVSGAFAFSQNLQPYAGHEKREIKALSAAEIESYRSGHGMGFGLAAELNHYPGPKHVLELGKELGIDEAQSRKTQAIYDRMHAETVRLGERLVEEERTLDRLFARATIAEASLAKSVLGIARLQGEVRLAHLKAHLEMRAILTPAQVARYDVLRGYGGGAPRAHDPAHHHGDRRVSEYSSVGDLAVPHTP